MEVWVGFVIRAHRVHGTNSKFIYIWQKLKAHPSKFYEKTRAIVSEGMFFFNYTWWFVKGFWNCDPDFYGKKDDPILINMFWNRVEKRRTNSIPGHSGYVSENCFRVRFSIHIDPYTEMKFH